jgi:long-chain acyl-CoA synthetase
VPLSHSYGLSSLAMPALRRGNLLVFPEPGWPFAPLEAAAEWEVSFFPTTPAWLNVLLRVARLPAWPRSLRLTLSAGAHLDGETAARFRAAVGRPVHTFYGSSECGGICFDRDGGAAERGTVGAPIEGVRVALEPFEEGAAEGIVTVVSPAVAAGYAPEAEPRLADGRFVTSDLGSWLGNEVALAGRVDDLINVRGKKVSPREVEDVVRRLAGVEEVAVVGVPQPGTGGHVVRAVVAGDPSVVRAATVIAHCRERLAPHKVPRSVVVVDRLPRNARGKLDRNALVAVAPAGDGE